MKTLYQRIILTLGITDDHVVVRNQIGVGDLPLGAERLAAAGRAQNQTVGRFQPLAIYHDQVVGKGVQTVIQGFALRLKQLLCGKRNEDGRAAGGQSPLDFDLIKPQRQRRHHSFFLLKVQPFQRTVVLLSDSLGLKYPVFQLLPGTGGVHDQKSDQKHALIMTLQVFQQLFGLAAVGSQIGGKNIDVISSADSLLLFVNFALIQLGNFSLDLPDGCRLVDGLDVQINDQAAFHVEKVRHHPVVQLRSQNLQERNRAQRSAHAETAAIPEFKACGRNEIFGGKARARQPVPFKGKFLLSIHMENGMQKPQAFFSVQCFHSSAQTLEIAHYIRLDPLQSGPGGF